METTPYTTLDYGNVTANISYVDHACYHLYMGSDVLYSYKFQILWSLTAVVVGLAANTLNVLVFSSKHMVTMSSNVYLLALAISDSLFLVTFVLARTLSGFRCLYFHHAAFDIFNRSDVACKVLQYLLDLFSDYSALLILAFTVERYIACYHAVKFRELCTVFRARLLCLIAFVTIALFIAPYHMLCMGLPTKDGYRFEVCTILPEPKQYEDAFFYSYVVEVITFRVLPVIIIAVLNVFIIVKVTKIHRDRKERRSATMVNGRNVCQHSNRGSASADRHLQLTLMLILVSTTYILLYIPVLVHFFLSKFERMERLSVDESVIYVMQNYTTALDVTGFAINFFLYTMSGKVFRDQLVLIVCNRDPSASLSWPRCCCLGDEKKEGDRGRFARIQNGNSHTDQGEETVI